MQDARNGTAFFVMPHWSKGDPQFRHFFDEALKSIFGQTDKNWKLVIVDGGSPSKDAIDYLKKLEKDHPDRIKAIFHDNPNDGPGTCRNIGIKYAYEQGAPFIIYDDADDLIHEKRLEVVRKMFAEDPEVSVIYTTFQVIDENDRIVPREKLTPSLVEILDSHKANPPQGINAWIRIGTETGYTNCTCATSVRTELAYKYPFPKKKVSEDSHTWMRYSAGGGKFVYTPDVPFLYRIPQNTAGSASRSREGGKHDFYKTKAEVDTDGFKQAVEIALANGKIQKSQVNDLLIRFYIKLGETMAKENELGLAREQIGLAAAISRDRTRAVIAEKGLGDREWARV